MSESDLKSKIGQRSDQLLEVIFLKRSARWPIFR